MEAEVLKIRQKLSVNYFSLKQCYLVNIYCVITDGRIHNCKLVLIISAKEIVFSVTLVCLFACLSVCLSVNTITHKSMN